MGRAIPMHTCTHALWDQPEFLCVCMQAYAMTEASHQMTSNPLPKHGERKPGTVGKAQGSVKVGPSVQSGRACVAGN